MGDFHQMNIELLDSFDFACKVKNLTPASHKCYAERLTYLARFADSIDKGLDAITHHDIQTYIMSIIDRVSAEPTQYWLWSKLRIVPKKTDIAIAIRGLRMLRTRMTAPTPNQVASYGESNHRTSENIRVALRLMDNSQRTFLKD